MTCHLVSLLALVATAPANTVAIEVATFGMPSQSSSTLVFSPVVHVALVASERWVAELEWGLVTLHELSDDEAGFTRVRAGNLALSALRDFVWLGAEWRAGMGATLPAARLGDGVLGRRRDRNALAYASGVRGNRDLWLWAPERGSLLLPADVIWRLADGWIGGDAAVALLAPMGHFYNERTDLVLQAAAAAAYGGDFIEGGIRWQLVVVPTQPRDRLQWSVAPFFQLELGDVRARLEAVVPLGAPLAAFDLWSLNAGVEVTL